MPRGLRVVAACFAAWALLGGCDRAAQPGAAERVLRVANWGGPGNDPGFLKLERDLRDEFLALHPGVRIEVEHIPGPGQYESKLIMMIVSGDAPDVVQLDASSAAVFIDNDILLDLSPLIARDARFRVDDYFESVVDVFRRAERLFAIPLDFTPMVMLYNKRLFDEANVAYPEPGWTWDDFLVKAEALTRPARDGRPKQYGFHFLRWMPHWVTWLWHNGGAVLSPDGTQAVGYFDGPESRAALHFLVDLIQKHGVAPSLAESAAAGVDLFRAQRAAMHLTGHWELIELRADQLDIGVVSLPSNVSKRETVMYASGLAVTAATRAPDLAWEYVKFMCSADVQKRRVATGLAISGNRAAAAHFAGNPIEDAFLAEVPFARPPMGARVQRYGVCEDLGREMIEDVLNTGAPLDAAAHRTAQLMQAAVRTR
ncbi:MAG: sugar ABC transporter substrate-binding protein [Phycisphaerae bacterium]